ncbi:AI-2E family transporter [Suicoccus acidiformans]|uniref:AI-2E family transporter n=1 Tax=Suicoccus acidiformans TaxID=2036206 RepID=A0A347WLS1_9LACT|nr:AI-2E family transporter [Suicoccus acidiformans]AXY26028.1 AI-2E family transporter [Suicoccus acidiformans]
MRDQCFWRRIFFVGLGLIVIFWALVNLGGLEQSLSALIDILSPFLLGLVLAFVLNLPMSFFELKLTEYTGEYKSWYRVATILFSVILVGSFVMFVMFLVIPDLIETLSYAVNALPRQAMHIRRNLLEYFTNHPQLVQSLEELDISWDVTLNNFTQTLRGMIGDIITSIINYVPTLINDIFDGFISFVFAIYLLFSKEQLVRQMKKIVYALFPMPWANFFNHLGSFSFRTFKFFFGGQLISGSATGVVLFILMKLFNFPYALSISVITAVFTLIPFYGAILGGVVGAILISVVDLSKALWFIVLIVIVQQIDGNIIYPNIIGNSIGIPGIWVMVIVTVAGALFGLPGMVLSVPIFSIIYNFISENVAYELNDKDIVVTEKTQQIKQR